MTRYDRWVLGFIGPLMFGVVLLLALSDRPATEAVTKAVLQGGGHVGTMELRKQIRCPLHGCIWAGPFHSDDGQVNLRTATLYGAPADAHVGQQVRARGPVGSSATVYDMEGKGAREELLANTDMIVLSTTYLALWLGWVTRLWRVLGRWLERRLTATAESAPAPRRPKGPDLIADARAYLDKR